MTESRFNNPCAPATRIVVIVVVERAACFEIAQRGEAKPEALTFRDRVIEGLTGRGLSSPSSDSKAHPRSSIIIIIGCSADRSSLSPPCSPNLLPDVQVWEKSMRSDRLVFSRRWRDTNRIRSYSPHANPVTALAPKESARECTNRFELQRDSPLSRLREEAEEKARTHVRA